MNTCTGYTMLRGASIFVLTFSLAVISATTLDNVVNVQLKRKIKEVTQAPQNETHNRYCAPCPREARSLPRLVYSLDSEMTTINCSVNGDYMVSCRQDAGDVFMPSSFINKFFETYGELTPPEDQQKGETYNFRSSYGILHPVLQQREYSPFGDFLNFHKYGVEARPSILCVSAAEGVPVATQWDKSGYFYAISIAQFGLSHHAKALVEGSPVTRNIGSGDADLGRWKLVDPRSSVTRVMDTVNGIERSVMAFSVPGSLTQAGPTLPLNTQERALCLNIKLRGPGGMTVKIKTRQKTVGYVSYALVDKIMEVKGDHVTYGLKVENAGKWIWLTRDVFTDWLKGPGDPQVSSTWFLEITEVTLHGTGYLDNMTLSSSAHNQNLMQTADWLAKNQDEAGGWPTSIPVKTRGIQLPPNWYSAMAQGQAMSALVRAYNLTGRPEYLESAVQALDLFTRDSKDGGVRTRFLGQLDWYEEYPTSPSTFVLNGFIFSMLGLYDVMKTTSGVSQRLAERLWTSGLRSLKALLGLFDTGEGTLYDLRHVISHEPPNRARWDYHLTHIALTQEMAIIDGDPIFHEAAQRWIGYFQGKRSPHN